MFRAVSQSIWTLFSCFLVRMLGNSGPPHPTHLMLWAVASHLSGSIALFTSWIFYFFFSMTSALCSPTQQGSFPLNGSSGRFRWRTFCFLRMLECVLIWTSLFSFKCCCSDSCIELSCHGSILLIFVLWTFLWTAKSILWNNAIEYLSFYEYLCECSLFKQKIRPISQKGTCSILTST